MKPLSMLTIGISIICLKTEQPGSAETAARKVLTAKYAALDSVIVTDTAKTLKWLKANLAPNFVFSTPGHPNENRKQFIDEFVQLHKEQAVPEVREQKITINSVKETASGAVADVANHSVFRIKDAFGRMGPKGATHELTVNESFRETWKPKGGDWLLVKSVLLKDDTKIDGKPIGGKRP